MSDAEDILMCFVPDFETRDFIKSVDRSINMDILDKDVFTYPISGDSENGWRASFSDFLEQTPVGKIKNYFVHDRSQRELRLRVLKLKNDVDISKVLDSVFDRKDEVIEEVKTKFITELIEPLQQQIEEILTSNANKEQQLKDAQSNLEQLNKDKEQITKQLETIKF